MRTLHEKSFFLKFLFRNFVGVTNFKLAKFQQVCMSTSKIALIRSNGQTHLGKLYKGSSSDVGTLKTSNVLHISIIERTKRFLSTREDRLTYDCWEFFFRRCWSNRHLNLVFSKLVINTIGWFVYELNRGLSRSLSS